MDETEYKSFLYIYSHLKDILSERERFILDSIYGVSGEFLNDTQVAKILNISNSRVGQIRRKAERKLGKKLLELYDEVI
ncbi:sigma factor-like helix-turn-helix DNA-binding protein [Virgibacillus sp. SK37]|uniref:sigma factor-like helix-turn-helix DNA-binding protein n=1 Tax=Virgibacillus sp. SK37 TaxID=403957 RepID=UPI0018DDE34D|nr:sigma factor-like helix-turn-helix DNA-binding protein [Virgibacillus sp. SK37]